MITPTIGRVVWYTPHPARFPETTQPWPALICFVHDDKTINVGGFMTDGTAFHAHNVPLMQDDTSARPGDSGYCEWMPYQQAKAAEDAAKAPTK